MFSQTLAESHLKRLAARHGVEIVYIKTQWDSWASAGTKQVFVPKPWNALRYLIGLHELGHLADKVAGRVVVGHYPAAEAAAWDWAVKHAEPKLLKQMTNHMWTQVARAWVTSVTDRITPIG